MNTLPKRPASPLPRQLDDIRRIRLTYVKKDNGETSWKSTTAPITRERPASGQEILSLSPSLQRDLGHTNINDLILQTTVQLASEGRRLARAPRLL